MDETENVSETPDEQNVAIKWLAGLQAVAAVLGMILVVVGNWSEPPCDALEYDFGSLFVDLQVCFMFVAFGYAVWAFRTKRVGVLLVVLVTFSLMFQAYVNYVGIEWVHYNATHTHKTGCYNV